MCCCALGDLATRVPPAMSSAEIRGARALSVVLARSRSVLNAMPRTDVVMQPRIAGHVVVSLIDTSAGELTLRARRERDDAIRLIRTHTGPCAGAGTLARYRRAVELARRFGALRLCPELELVEDAGRAALSAPGELSLLAERTDRPMALSAFLPVASALVDAVAAAHAAHWVLGDLRPASLLVDAGATSAMVFDLQRACALDAPDDAPAAADGMLPYLAPERTGQVGRGGDPRTDLYALGATLFELLCGRPPFATRDPLKLVHSHLAEVAPRLVELRPELPAVVGELVAKLLAKSPDDRYQSCAGLRADLQRCTDAIARREPLPAFELGRDDARARLELPSKLYGRERETACVLDCFARAAAGQVELLLVTGPPGVGKSALIADAEPRMLEAGGRMVSGKFDQLFVHTPYSAIKRVFSELVRRMLGERDEQIAIWRSRLGEALGSQGRIVVDLIPELERILGPQPPVEVLGPVEAQQRLALVFGRLVRALARPEHPLILFLDDWQWADAASARLIQEIATAPEIGALLLILAYRDSELASSHPGHAAIERVRAASVAATSLALPPLALADLQRLVHDALRCPGEHAHAVAEVIAARTGGNPFFARSFLQSLHETGRLHRDSAGGWRCDLGELGAAEMDQTVLDLVVARIGRLSPPTRELVEIAACLASEVPLAELAAAAGRAPDQVTRELAEAVDAALLVRGDGSHRFVHDRVQEAAYGRIAATERPRLHLATGRRLLDAAERGAGENARARAVEQLNAGRALIVDRGERRALAELNLRAGQRARDATAYALAAHHAGVGIELLDGGGWSDAYPLALDLHALQAESEYLSGQFAAAERLYEVALCHARADPDRIRILTIQKDHYELQGRYLDAIEVLREGLQLVGIALPESDAELRRVLAAELAQVPRNLRGRTIASLVDAPEITDPQLVGTLHLLMGLLPPAYAAGRQPLFAVASLKIANFCLVHGNCEVSSAAFLSYAFVAGPTTGDYATAYEFGQLGLALSERYPNRAIRAWCYFLFGCGPAVWRRPLAECAQYLEHAFQLGVESGSLAKADYAACFIATHAFYRGTALAEVDAVYARYRDFLARSNPAMHLYLELAIRSMRRLTGRDAFDDTAFVAAFGDNAFFMATHAFGQLEAAYHLDDPERARACADAAIARVPEVLAGIYKVPQTAMYAALAWLAAAGRATGEDRARLRADAERQLALLDRLARACEDSFLHKALLVRGELARIDGQFEDAAALLDRAADAAVRAGFQQHAALARELAARTWYERGFTTAARAYLQEAYDGYRAWGATAKLAALEARHPDLLGPHPGAARELSTTAGAAPLDLLSVARASQAISREIERDAVLARLMHVVLETGGARRGALLLIEGERLRVVAATRGSGVAVGDAVGDDPGSHVVESIARYVARTGETVRIDDAARDVRFARDPQVRRRRCRSVICLPLCLKGRVIGALYLDNELSAGAFTPSRQTMLELLAAQAAISLDNARLYSDLKSANQAKDESLAMLGHELRNPLAPVLTACNLMAMQAPEQFARERVVIERQVKHMMRLVDDLLDVSRIARGKIELVRTRVDLAGIVRDAIELVSPLIEQRRTPLEVRLPPRPVPIHADPMRLAQVVSNVLSNAVKFSDPGGPVSIALDAEADRAVLRVTDRGAGIAADLLPRVFDVFVQGRQARDRRLGGLGLGLAIARNLVALHGGSITAHSDGPGRGSEFRIDLPLDLPLQLGAGPSATRSYPPPVERAARLRVLVVDDNADAARLLVDALHAMGHATLVTHDGPSALARLAEFQPDVALLDIGLPVIDGFEVARRIRGQLGAAAPRLIAVSGYAAQVGVADPVFDDYLVKPVALDRLARALAGPADQAARCSSVASP
jgi:predicted ATPase/signal transduction histidine kinase/ActR/RegA family two-component response regulator